jgi:hypothetical protein
VRYAEAVQLYAWIDEAVSRWEATFPVLSIEKVILVLMKVT